MGKYEYILLDLDGTITDPALGITNSVMHALNHYNIKCENRSDLYVFIGPPLYASFMKYYGFSKEQAENAVAVYREYYQVAGIFECNIYPGIELFLQNLKKAGKKVVLATSKPEEYANRILEHFGLNGYFDLVAGATMDGSRIKKEDVIKYAFTKLGITDPSLVVMVGDREFDILGARINGANSIGVTYGYGSRQELETANATYICDTVPELEEIIFKKC